MGMCHGGAAVAETSALDAEDGRSFGLQSDHGTAPKASLLPPSPLGLGKSRAGNKPFESARGWRAKIVTLVTLGYYVIVGAGPPLLLPTTSAPIEGEV